MNWTAILTAIFGYIEKNPQLFESLFTALLNLLVNNPPILNKVVDVAIKKVESTIPSVPPVA